MAISKTAKAKASKKNKDGMTNPNADPENPQPKIAGGTLVICTVSLVGQWINEIRDKLVSNDIPVTISSSEGGPDDAVQVVVGGGAGAAEQSAAIIEDVLMVDASERLPERKSSRTTRKPACDDAALSEDYSDDDFVPRKERSRRATREPVSAKARKSESARVAARAAQARACPLSIYCYHGSSRKKCAALLAEHDVVITTYSILGVERVAAVKDCEAYTKKQPWTCTFQKPLAPKKAKATKNGPPPPIIYGPPCNTANDGGTEVCRKCDAGRRLACEVQKMQRSKFLPTCEGVRWHRIVLDESHYIKNPQAKWSKAVLQLEGNCRWCVSGTPINTGSVDLFTQLKFIGCEPFANFTTWGKANLAMPHCKEKGPPASHQLNVVRGVLQGLMMRHRMSQIRNGRMLLALPPKIEEVVYIDFNTAEKKAYLDIHKTARKRYEAIKKAGDLTRKTLVVMALLMPLRRASSGGRSMQQIQEAGFKQLDRLISVDLDAAAAGAGGASAAAGPVFGNSGDECTICMDLIEEPTLTPCGHCFCRDCITTVLSSAGPSSNKCPICRSACTAVQLRDKPEEVDASAEDEDEPVAGGADDAGGASGGKDIEMASKCKMLMKKLKEVREDDPSAKSLVFSHFQPSIEFMKTKLTEAGYTFRTLSGSMSRAQRTKALEDFQNDVRCPWSCTAFCCTFIASVNN